ncbi:MAG: DUF5107 domain-containing protein [Anaerolineales bacterium]|nr:DUF5107 domain-containing protein [Anaerolineales bacterium]
MRSHSTHHYHHHTHVPVFALPPDAPGWGPYPGYPYRRLDWNCYGSPTPVPQTYRLLVLENEYLRVSLLPELGGRVYQLTYKPTGHNELYQNPVIKPAHWGPPEQGWWLAVGGIEWCWPVEEHGYRWAEPWSYQVASSAQGVTVTLRESAAVERLRARVSVHLPADRAVLIISPRIENPTMVNLAYKYWTNAMLAPGAANTVSQELHFVFSARTMSVHSTGDCRLPGCWPSVPTGPDYRFTWPEYGGVLYARLGNWRQWLGFFEYPQAAASFVGVYDRTADEGVVRVFPAHIARGSKGFGLGWSQPIDPQTWTDDGSTYVELHGGVAPTFWDWATLAGGSALSWSETWYPLSGAGWLSAATADGALGVWAADGMLEIGVHATAPHPPGATTLLVRDRASGDLIAQWSLPAVGPGAPVMRSVADGGRSPDQVCVVFYDAQGRALAAHHLSDCIPLRIYAPVTLRNSY